MNIKNYRNLFVAFNIILFIYLFVFISSNIYEYCNYYSLLPFDVESSMSIQFSQIILVFICILVFIVYMILLYAGIVKLFKAGGISWKGIKTTFNINTLYCYILIIFLVICVALFVMILSGQILIPFFIIIFVLFGLLYAHNFYNLYTKTDVKFSSKDLVPLVCTLLFIIIITIVYLINSKSFNISSINITMFYYIQFAIVPFILTHVYTFTCFYREKKKK